MSQRLISRSEDLLKLQDDGYDIEIRGGHLLLRDVPYVTENRTVKTGTLVSDLTLSGDQTAAPSNHVVHFGGEVPCASDGSPLSKVINSSNRKDLGNGIVIDHTFSSKPAGTESYPDYYEKMTTYATILSSQAQRLDPMATARTYPVIEAEDDASPFRYVDTASTRAGIGAVNDKLSIDRVAIIGLGGTGSYILDFVAKTPVKRIDLFDGDVFLQHNAFRSPGAPTVDDLREKANKAVWWANVYDGMRKGVVAHDKAVDDESLDELSDFDFVFLCIDAGPSKKAIVDKLHEAKIPYVDTGIGVDATDGQLGGVVRVTASTPEKNDHVSKRVGFDDAGENEYSQNIQVADLNALNAILAVIKWKKLFGFYRDLDGEHHSTYTIDGNHLTNEEYA